MIIKNVAVYFAKLDPENPDRYDPENLCWSLQIRTFDKAEKRAWADLGLNCKTVDPDEGEIYYKVSLKKPITSRKTGRANDPVQVINGKGVSIDPRSIGNGSICNIRVFQYDSVNPKTKAKVLVSMLQGVQVIRHIVYVPKPREEFEEAEYEAIEPAPTDGAPAPSPHDDSAF
jgi:hypothetical protein